MVPGTGLGGVDINILPSALVQRVGHRDRRRLGGLRHRRGRRCGELHPRHQLQRLGSSTRRAAAPAASDHEQHGISPPTWGMPPSASALHLLVKRRVLPQADRVDGFADRDWYQGYSLINNPAANTLTTRLRPTDYYPRAERGFVHLHIRRPHLRLLDAGLQCPTTSALYRRYFQPDGTLGALRAGRRHDARQHYRDRYPKLRSALHHRRRQRRRHPQPTCRPRARGAGAASGVPVSGLRRDARPQPVRAGPGGPEHRSTSAIMADVSTAVSGSTPRITIYRDNAVPAGRRAPDHGQRGSHLLPDEPDRRPRRPGPRKPPEAGQPDLLRHAGLQVGHRARGVRWRAGVERLRPVRHAPTTAVTSGAWCSITFLAAVDAIPDPNNASNTACRAATHQPHACTATACR